jgi:hypothetical protein
MQRQAMERRIIRRLATDAIAAGYRITVDNGGYPDDYALLHSADVRAVMAAVMQTDEDVLFFCRHDKPSGVHPGWVKLVYGNDGYDVVCDYTIDLEPILAGANALADKLEAEAC